MSNIKKHTVVIMQPGYLPWLGFFELMWKSNTFIIYDTVSYDKNGWRNRNRIKTPAGPQWLTVPVRTSSIASKLLKDIEIDNSSGWNQKHLSALQVNYARAPWLKEYLPSITELLRRPWQKLRDLDVALIKLTADLLGLEKNIILSSELKIKSEDRVGRLIEMVKYLGGTNFYEPAGGRAYLGEKEIAEFEEENISFEFQNYQHPFYRQLHGEFLPNMAVVDLLLNEGPRSLEILTKGGAPN